MLNRTSLYKIITLWIVAVICSNVAMPQAISGSFVSKFKRFQKGEQFSATINQQWNDTVWRGERVHNQLLIWSSADIDGVSYQVDDLTGDNNQIILASDIRLRFEKYIKGDPQPKDCGAYSNHSSYIEIADALSSVAINNLNVADPLKIWVTVDVPRDTKAGKYRGAITIGQAAHQLTFNITFYVVDFVLPPVRDWNFNLDLWQYPNQVLDHYNRIHSDFPLTLWSDQHFRLFREGYKMLADMGQKAITAHIKQGALGAPSMIKWTKKINGSWEYDFYAFDKYIDSLMAWGITRQINCFSPVGWNKNVIPYLDEKSGSWQELAAPIGSPEYIARWNDFLNYFRAHLINKKWFDKTILFMDEVPETEMTAVVDMIQKNNSGWKIGLAHSHFISPLLMNSLYNASGILGVASSSGRDGRITTFYTSCTQIIPNNYVTPGNNPAEMTWMGWHALKENYNGYLRWAYDYWQLSDPFDARDGSNTAGDFSMVYRGENGNAENWLTSIRAEMLREGIQDHEKATILKNDLSNVGYYDDLNSLLNIQNLFSASSGTNALALVTKAQSALKKIVAKSGTITGSKKDMDSGKTLWVYISPESRAMKINIPQDFKITGASIYNTLGQKIWSINSPDNLQSELTFNPGKISPGIYFLALTGNNRLITKKIIVEK